MEAMRWGEVFLFCVEKRNTDGAASGMCADDRTNVAYFDTA
jgi:hypothetical protein